jgi:flagellar P-ring protein precursor FlgI
MSRTRITQLKAKKERFIRGCFAAVLIGWLLCNSVSGLTRIRDIARPLGERANKLHGTGLVVGLNGTGDGGDSLMTMRPLAVYLRNLGNPVSAEELNKAKNVAFVQVTAELSRTGVRNGDQIDVYVSSIGGAKSLVGGKLIVTPLRSTNINDDNVYAIAQGLITITDPDVETSGVIKGGATVESDFLHQYVEYDNQNRPVFMLVLDDDQANFQVAKAVEMIINEETALPGEQYGMSGTGENSYEQSAFALDAKNIRVVVPEKQVKHPSQFIARVLNLPVDLPDPEATVFINEKTGTIAITGNVEIAPITVHVNGLNITVINPAPQISPLVKQSEWTSFDTTHSGGIKITDLTNALDQLNVPVREKIQAIYAINRAGALRARIVKE